MENKKRISKSLLVVTVFLIAVVWAFSASVAIAKGKTIDAEEKVTGTIDKAASNCNVEELIVTEQNPMRPGYNFVGWFADKECTQQVTDNAQQYSGKLFAKWQEKTIRELYNAQSDTYSVYTYNQLNDIRNLAAYNPIYGEKTISENISLMADIDMSFTNWIPIEASFLGRFDGNEHKIIGMKIVALNKVTWGLFQRIETKGRVYNLKFSDIDISVSSEALSTSSFEIGAVAGMCKGLISGCEVLSGNINATTYKSIAGSIAGMCSKATITNCSSTAAVNINGSGILGGIVGSAGVQSVINACTNQANVFYTFKEESGCAAGIAGKILGETVIKYCKNFGLVKYEGPNSSNKSIQPCMAQIVGWKVSGTLEYNDMHKHTDYTLLKDSQQTHYCSLYEYGRLGA